MQQYSAIFHVFHACKSSIKCLSRECSENDVLWLSRLGQKWPHTIHQVLLENSFWGYSLQKLSCHLVWNSSHMKRQCASWAKSSSQPLNSWVVKPLATGPQMSPEMVKQRPLALSNAQFTESLIINLYHEVWGNLLHSKNNWNMDPQVWDKITIPLLLPLSYLSKV